MENHTCLVFELFGYFSRLKIYSITCILRPLKGITGRLAQLVERRTREHNVSGLYRCGFESPAGQTKITNCLSDETLNRGPVWRCYTPSTLKNQAEFSVVSSCILALSPVTTNRLLGASLRWATGSDDK